MQRSIRRARLILPVLGLGALAVATLVALHPQYDISADNLVDPGSTTFRHEVEFEGGFGADPIVVLLSGNVPALLQGQGLSAMVNLEDTLVSPADQAAGVHSLYGPASIAEAAGLAAEGSFLSRVQGVEAAAQQKAIGDARAAGKSDADAQAAGSAAAQAAGQAEIQNAIKDYPELASIGLPSPTNPRWVSAIFLSNGQPKARFAAIVPDAGHAVITARLRPDSSEQGIQAIHRSLLDALRAQPIPGIGVTVSGAPILQVAIERALRLALVVGMAVGALASALLLLLGIRDRRGPGGGIGLGWWRRLLPLFGGALAVALLAGALWLVGEVALRVRILAGLDQPLLQTVFASLSLALSPATLAAFPIALGLAVDYGVQFLFRYRQARARLEAEGMASPAAHPAALEEAGRGAGRATRIAALCTAGGLAALLASSIPMVRQFGVAMALGAALAWISARTVVLLALRGWPPRTPAAPTAADDDTEIALFGLVGEAPVGGAGGEGTGAAGEGSNAAGQGPWGPRLLALGRRRGGAMLAVAGGVAAVGWLAFPFSTYQTDPERLLSRDLPAIQDLDRIRHATGTSGELDFVLSGADVTSQDALAWERDLTAAVTRDSDGRLRPLGSLADLFTTINGGQAPAPDRIKAFTQLIPPYFTDALVTRDHSLARIPFGIDLEPVDQLQRDLARIQADVDAPPGYSYYPAGVTWLEVAGLAQLQSGQVILNLLGAALVLAVLLLVYRRRRLALLAWAPTLLVAGWSTALLTVLQVPLDPMTAVLGALVVAFGTEFAVLWLERYREALAALSTEPAAIAASAGAAPGILVSGGALALGFLALCVGGLPGVSALGFDLPMVRDFGLVAALDIVLAVLASLVVLPELARRFPLAAQGETPAPRSAPAPEPASSAG
jgi:predicted RND superfamily exporter protein